MKKYSSFENNFPPFNSIMDRRNQTDSISVSLKSFQTSVKNHKKDYIVALVLFIINLLNYMDRYTITGLLTDIKEYYQIDDAESGLLQTSFIVSYTIFCPIFGYLGDRFSRKNIVLFGLIFWSLITLSSSFVPRNMFFLFVVMRSLLGIGEASYSTVAPTILSDLFTDEWRTKVIAFFSFAIPVGSGCGFIIGYALKNWFHAWQAALRFTPIVGVVCVVLLVFLVDEPERGAAEGNTNSIPTSWIEDIRLLTKNPSFIFITFGFTAVCFVLGSLSWFAVIYLGYSINAEQQNSNKSNMNYINYIFGSITVVAGILGVVIGAESGRRLRRIYDYADPLVCAFGLIVGAPCFLVSIVLAKYHLYWSLFNIFLTEILMCFTWALVTDMTMSVVNPRRRSTAAAYQMIIGHALGDAGSPYFIGLIKNTILKNMDFINEYDKNYYSMQCSFLIDAPILIIGGLLFVCSSFYIVSDKLKVTTNKNNSTIYNEDTPIITI